METNQPKEKSFLQKNLPWILAVVLFLVFCYFYFLNPELDNRNKSIKTDTCFSCKTETESILQYQEEILKIQRKQIQVVKNNEEIAYNQKFLRPDCGNCEEKRLCPPVKKPCPPLKKPCPEKTKKPEVKPKPKVEPKSRKEEKKTNRSKKTETKVDCDTCLKYPAPKPKKECNPCGVLKTKYFNGVEYEEYTGWNPETKKYRTQDESPVDASGNTKDGFYYGDNKWWLKKN